jgi:hypothetical protein
VVLGRAKFAAFLQTHLQASLPMAFQKLRSIRFANDPVFGAHRWTLALRHFYTRYELPATLYSAEGAFLP